MQERGRLKRMLQCRAAGRYGGQKGTEGGQLVRWPVRVSRASSLSGSGVASPSSTRGPDVGADKEAAKLAGTWGSHSRLTGPVGKARYGLAA